MLPWCPDTLEGFQGQITVLQENTHSINVNCEYVWVFEIKPDT